MTTRRWTRRSRPIYYFDIIHDYPSIGGVVEFSQILFGELKRRYGARLVSARAASARLGLADTDMPYLERERRVATMLAAADPDATFFFPNFHSPIARRTFGPRPRIVNVVHDVQFAFLPELFDRAHLAWLHQAFAETRENADEIVFVSQTSRDQYVACFGQPKRCRVIYNPVRVTAAGTERNTAAPFLLTAAHGDHHPHKNVEGLLRLFAALAARSEDLQLYATGHGREAFQRALELFPENVRQRVHHLGHVPRAELNRLYGGAQAYVSLSRFEGFNMSAAEAASHGTPLILSDLPVHRELFGPQACLVDPLAPSVDEVLCFLNRKEGRHAGAWRYRAICSPEHVGAAYARVVESQAREKARPAEKGHRRQLAFSAASKASRKMAPAFRSALLVGTVLSGSATGIALALVMVAPAALAADGGLGGGDGAGSAGGTGGTLESPVGQAGESPAGGGGGGASTWQGTASGSGGNGAGAGAGGSGGGEGGGGGLPGYTGDGTSPLPPGIISGSPGGNGGGDVDGSYYGGGGGGGYGALISLPGSSLLLDQNISGGAGGNGGSGAIDSGGGGGGGGGGGLYFGGSTGNSLTLSGMVQGGNGGAGGSVGAGFGNSGGAGGDGGEGVWLTGGALTVSGSVIGGNGGNGGNGGEFGGAGGDGGAGVWLNGGTLTVSGSVIGGNGGASGTGGGALGGAAGGFGVRADNGGKVIVSPGGSIQGGDDFFIITDGAAIVGANLTVITAGQIAGGLSGDGQTHNAIAFTAGANRLELQNGYSFVGNVAANGGSDTLALGGAENASFDVSGIGGQYTGFEAFEKVGASTWTLTGATTAVTTWRLSEGILSVSSDEQLGDPSSSFLQFDGGTLQNTASFATARTIELFQQGGVFQTDANLQITGTIDGSGVLTKTGAGTLTLTGANVYHGGTTIAEGVLQVSADANLGDYVGGLTFNGGTLQNTASFAMARDVTLADDGGTFQTDADLTVSGRVAGDGVLTKTGAGILTLTGTNTYKGGTTVSQGSLVAAVTGALGTGPVTVDGESGTEAGVTFTGSANAGTLAIGLTNLNSNLTFTQNASAGAATIDNSGRISFHDTASAGTATIVNDSGAVSFYGNSTAADAAITVANKSGLDFYGSSTAGNATITNTRGWVRFYDNSTADGATIVNNGIAENGQVDIAGLAADGIGIGSLSGAGTVYLGSKSLTLGGLGRNDTISGAMLDGGLAGGTGGALTKIGTGTLTLTGANAYTGGTTVEAGTLDIGGGGATGSIAGNVDVTTGGTLAFNRSNDFAFAGTIGGDGAIEKLGAGAATLTGNSSAFTGTTSVNAGTLVVDGTLGGVIDVLSGARLEGTGTVGTTTIASGGTIAPGHSPGTLTVAGAITFAAGSTYEVDITPALDGDLIDASGAATINGGTVDVVKAAGTYTPGSRWTIIGADGGVTGTFDALTQNMPFVDLALTYDPNNVYLDVARNDVAFCDVAQTSNQCATGDAIESTGPGTQIYDVVAAIPDENGARAALEALSGEIHASIKSAMLEDSRFVREAALDRTRAVFSGAAAPSLPVMGYGSENLTPEQQEALAREGKSAEVFAPAPADTDRFAVWARGFGSWGQWDSDGNAADFERSIGGIFVGADAAVAETWRLGLLTGYSRSSFDTDDLTSSGDSDNYHLGLYGGTEWGNLGLRLGAAHTWHDIETGRSISFPGFTDSAQASYDARTAQAFGELGYRIDSGNFAFEPFANLAYVNVHTSGFTEEGGAAALTSASSDTDATFTTLGLRAAADFRLGGVTATARGMVGWRHAFGDVTPLPSFAFAGSDAFTIAGTPIAEDALVLEAGFDVGLSEKALLGVTYSGQVASKASDHGFRADFTVKF